MTKVTDIRSKKPRKPLTPEEIARRAMREEHRHVNPCDEPDALASGKTSEDGDFVDESDDDDERADDGK
jgi:hypothetical protein